MGDPNNNRGGSWQYVLLAIPAIAAAVGVQYLVRHQYPASSRPVDVASGALKPSFYKMDEKTQKQTSAYQALSGSNTYEHEHDSGARVPAGKGTKVAAVSHESDDADVAAEPKNYTNSWSKPLQEEAHRKSELAETAQKLTEKPVTGESTALSGNLCQPIEYKGDGPATKVSGDEWNKVMTQFHDVKDRLADWLDHHRKEFMDKTVVAMEKQIKSVEIQRPIIAEEPDLNWRGIAIFTYDAANKPIIRVGSGFVKLAVKEPARARFELARLVAQSVSPCELQKLGADAAWEPLLGCMGVKEDNACASGTFSDAGWAVSSALATVVANPGCTIPAFATADAGKCVKKVPLPLSTASASASPEAEKPSTVTTTAATTGTNNGYAVTVVGGNRKVASTSSQEKK